MAVLANSRIFRNKKSKTVLLAGVDIFISVDKYLDSNFL